MSISREQATITAEAAHAAVAAGIKKADEMGKRMNVAVVDRGGNLVAFLCNANAPWHSAGLAIDKAYTSAAFNMPSKAWDQVIGKAGELVRIGIMHRERLVVFGGGFPIRKDGVLLGAIGASGGSEDDDEACTRAALAAIGADAV